MKQLTLYDWRHAGGLYNPLLPYKDFISAQKKVADQRMNQTCGDTLIITAHPPTITLGARSLREQLPHIHALPAHIASADNAITDEQLLGQATEYLRHAHNINLVKTNRGGSVWYHDHGVLQLYLIMEVHAFGVSDIIYPLEEALLRTLNTIGIPARRADQRT
ncbi:MAG: hypothetical protein AAB972_04340 [Patescibacteria group bacterium]